mmetsp:Transcript_74666/g.178117  ORF Transcript_74666/g.178117 Transcript_74666/m.178117 type:complete len:261 (+) Transcript_74666:321-1103(+)
MLVQHGHSLQDLLENCQQYRKMISHSPNQLLSPPLQRAAITLHHNPVARLFHTEVEDLTEVVLESHRVQAGDFVEDIDQNATILDVCLFRDVLDGNLKVTMISQRNAALHHSSELPLAHHPHVGVHPAVHGRLHQELQQSQLSAAQLVHLLEDPGQHRPVRAVVQVLAEQKGDVPTVLTGRVGVAVVRVQKPPRRQKEHEDQRQDGGMQLQVLVDPSPLPAFEIEDVLVYHPRAEVMDLPRLHPRRPGRRGPGASGRTVH